MEFKFNIGDYVWYNGGGLKVYKPGPYEIVAFLTELPVIISITLKEKVQRVVASDGQIRSLTENEKILYGR